MCPTEVLVTVPRMITAAAESGAAAASEGKPDRSAGGRECEAAVPFALQWLGREIGAAEVRPIISADICLNKPEAAARTLIAGMAERSGGHCEICSPGWMQIWWGWRPDNMRSSLTVVERIASQLSVSCLLDVQLATIRPELLGNPCRDARPALPATGIFARQAYRQLAEPSRFCPVAVPSPQGAEILYFRTGDGIAARAACRERESKEDAGRGEWWKEPSPQYLHYLNQLDRLGPYAALVKAAALVTGEANGEGANHLTVEQIAATFNLDPRQLVQPIEQLVTRRILVLRDDGIGFSFCDRDLARGARAAVPSDHRQALQQRAAAAALRSVVAGTHRPATVHPPTAYDELVRLRQAAIDAAVFKGNASSAVYDAYMRCYRLASTMPRELASGPCATVVEPDRPDCRDYAFDALWGLQSYHLVKGELRAAMTVGEMLVTRSALWGQSDGLEILAHRLQGLTCLLGGDLTSAVQHGTRTIELYRPDAHAALRLDYGSDQCALAHAHRCWAETLRGQGRKAAQDRLRAERLVIELAHPHTTAHAFGVLAIAALTGGDHQTASVQVASARLVAVTHGLSYWQDWCELLEAAIEGRRGTMSAYRRLKLALGRYCMSGAQQLVPIAQCWLAACALVREQPGQALAHADEGLASCERTGLRLYEPELLRMKAMALARRKQATTAMELLEQAYNSAAESGAWLFAQNVAGASIEIERGPGQTIWLLRYQVASNHSVEMAA